MYFCKFWGILFLAVGIITSAFAESVLLTGTVFDATGTPVEGAAVQLLNESYVRDTTDNSGRYTLAFSGVQWKPRRTTLSDMHFRYSNNAISFLLTKPVSLSVSLVDIRGRLVQQIVPVQKLSVGTHRYTIDKKKAGSGLYLLQVRAGSDDMYVRYLNCSIPSFHAGFETDQSTWTTTLAKSKGAERYVRFEKKGFLKSTMKVVSFEGENDAFLQVKDGIQSPCRAYYYSENDGTDPGKGNDGSNAAITPKLIDSGLVDRPSINYGSQSFKGIICNNFYGVWKGEITINDSAQPLRANVDLSWSNASLFVDDILLATWPESKVEIPMTLAPGKHTYHVDMHNHWHTTGFNVSFTNYTKTTIAGAASVMNKSLTDGCKSLYVGGYESGTLYNEATLSLPKTDDSLVLFLASYSAVNWLINNPHNTKIAGVAIGGYAPGTTVTGVNGAAIFEITDLSRSYEDFAAPSAEIERITGKKPVWTFGSYYLDEVEVSF